MGLFGGKKEEGLLETYGVTYLGGLPEYRKAKAGKIDLKIFRDRFEFHPTMATGWFKKTVIPYDTVTDVQLADRQVSTVEAMLGGLDSRHLNQKNNIHVHYKGASGEYVLRVEMLSGITVMAQAGKCREFEDLLRTHGIRDRWAKRPEPPPLPHAASSSPPDIVSRLQQLAELKSAGHITQDEFDAAKLRLLTGS